MLQQSYPSYLGPIVRVSDVAGRRALRIVNTDHLTVLVIVWRLRGNIIRTAPCWVV